MVAHPLPPYTFEEFTVHADRVFTLWAEEPEPKEHTFESTVIKTRKVFAELYLDPDERDFKHKRFCMMTCYICSHLDDFDQSDYAVVGSERVGAMVREHLLRAVHKVFTSPDLFKRTTDPSPEEIMKLADQFRDVTD